MKTLKNTRENISNVRIIFTKLQEYMLEFNLQKKKKTD